MTHTFSQQDVVEAFDSFPLKPDRVVEGDESVSFYLFGADLMPGGAHKLYAALDWYRDNGRVVLSTKDRVAEVFSAGTVFSIQAAIAEAARFVGREWRETGGWGWAGAPR